MSFLDLPTELLLEICNSLQPTHILDLACVNPHFQAVFLPLLYKINVLHCKSSALIWGSRNGASHVVKRILDHHNADVNTRDQNSRTAIFHAVENQDEVILDILLNDHRTKVNCRDRNSQTPLLYALCSRKSSMAYRLLKHLDISVTAEDGKGRTALWYAIATHNSRLIQQLLKKGRSTIDIPDILGFSPLSVAIYQGNLPLVKQLLFLLFHTARHGQHVRGFSSQTAEPDGYDKIPLLCLAVRKRKRKIARLLLSYGADVNVQDYLGKTSLHYAAEIGDLNSIAMLLNWDGIELNSTDFLGRTALQIATEQGYYKIFVLLIKAGADINAVDTYQSTVLHQASMKGNISMVKLLLRIPQVNINAQDIYGSTALCLARGKQVKRLLLACDGVDVNATGLHQTGALHHAVTEADLSTTRILLQHAELDPNQTDDMGWTPLYHATDSGNLAMVELLLTRADIDVNKSAPPPLFVAARYGHVQIFDRLIKMEGVNIHNGWCGTLPLDVSIARNHCHIVTVLIRQHVKENPNLTTTWFDRALATARQWGHTDLVRVLLAIQSIKQQR
ncbi:uncharacterized protein N7487_002998 [Penicillium crustosum]|uniref:uncharacterized protein n=1 Tax=Penicillium crustosum TaxID=36656 RepID=UPI0023958713|nr:uncharacterized protein N7487_002998 [Penicillium crustosum]KAJ5419448.1 hypothetical protein N7487_002998 [Penicillium crustosum]